VNTLKFSGVCSHISARSKRYLYKDGVKKSICWNFSCIAIVTGRWYGGSCKNSSWSLKGEAGSFAPAGWSHDEVPALTRVQAVRMQLEVNTWWMNALIQ